MAVVPGPTAKSTRYTVPTPYAQTQTGFNAYNGSIGVSPGAGAQSRPGTVLGSSTTATGNSFASPGAPSVGANPGAGTQVQTPGQPQVDYNAIYQPALDALNGALSSAQQGYTSQEASINANNTQAAGQLNNDLIDQQNQIGQAKTTQQTQTKNAMTQAQQAYNEISQGIQSRYGGTTGTGAFANEIAGRATSNNMAQFQTNLTNALGGLDQASQHVQLVHDQNIKDLSAQTEAAIQQAKSALQSNIAQIGMQQGQVQSAKAQQIANAVIDYQHTVQSVQAMNAQYAQQLQLQQNQIQAQLAYARQIGTAGLQTGLQNANNQPQPTAVTAGGLFGNTNGTQQNTNQTGGGQTTFPTNLNTTTSSPAAQSLFLPQGQTYNGQTGFGQTPTPAY